MMMPGAIGLRHHHVDIGRGTSPDDRASEKNNERAIDMVSTTIILMEKDNLHYEV